MPKYPIGISDFKKLIEREFDFVDKSLFIKEIIDDNAEVLLLPRPRRFGKTLNMSMLRYFFDQKEGQNENIFQALKINQAGKRYLAEQHQYPILYLTLKEAKFSTYEETLEEISEILQGLFSQHDELLTSDRLKDHEKEYCQLIIAQGATKVQLTGALRRLTEYLYRHYERKVFILIDEYDAPIISSYTNGYYKELMDFMRIFLGKALKDNPFLHKAIITGILCVAKESIFSELNNIDVHTMFSKRFAQYFGFTEEEVNDLLLLADCKAKGEEIRSWYNGYKMGDCLVYNPWSIMKCLNEEGKLSPYWVNTSDNIIIKDLLKKASPEVKSDLERLLQGQTISQQVEENLTFKDLDQNNALSTWSFLTLSGYLTTAACESRMGELHCDLRIPNVEVHYLYNQFIKHWFTVQSALNYERFLSSLVSGDVALFTELLEDYLQKTPSYFDLNQSTPEQVYHSFVLGMVVGLSQDYLIKSNRESGRGRYDVMIIPKDKTKLGIILEFKTAAASAEKESLEQAAKDALQQIENKNYAAELTSDGVTKILKLGLAFRGKEVFVVSD